MVTPRDRAADDLTGDVRQVMAAGHRAEELEAGRDRPAKWGQAAYADRVLDWSWTYPSASP